MNGDAVDKCRVPERCRTLAPHCLHGSKHQRGRVPSVRLLVRVRLGAIRGHGIQHGQASAIQRGAFEEDDPIAYLIVSMSQMRLNLSCQGIDKT